MAPPKPTSDALSATEIESQLGALSPGDWQRALSMARLLSAGMAGLDPDDLLSEAMTKLLAGERVWRRGVPVLVTLKLVMRSVASNARKKEINAPIDRFANAAVSAGDVADDGPAPIDTSDERGPDNIVESRMQLALVARLVAGDEEAELVLLAWSIGLRGAEAAKEAGLDAKRYDAARQRLIRKIKSVADARKER